MLIPYDNQRAMQRYRRYIPQYGTRAAAAATLLRGAIHLYRTYRSSGSSHKQAVKKANQAYKRRVKGGYQKPPKTLKKRLDNLAKKVDASNGTLIYRLRRTDAVLSAVNQQTHSAGEHIDMATLEAVLGQLRFFNPALPGTLTQASGASATYYRDYLFTTMYTKLQCINNYQVPAVVTLYVLSPKKDTSITPITAFTNGLTDVGGPSSSSPLVYLTDSDEFNDLWKIEKTTKKVLNPGNTTSIAHSINNIKYSPATYDSHALSYQRRFGSYAIVVRVEGVLGHDSAADEQGFLQAGVDVHWETKLVVNYDAGIDLKYIYLDDTSDTFTNGGLVSSKPVSDNIAYSLS